MGCESPFLGTEIDTFFQKFTCHFVVSVSHGGWALVGQSTLAVSMFPSLAQFPIGVIFPVHTLWVNAERYWRCGLC